MVRIPSYDNYNILGGNTQQAYSNVQASPDAFGAGVGRATEQLGGAMQDFEQQAEKVYKEVKTLDAENRYANETSELFRQADMEYTKAEGKNAIDGYQGAIDRVKKIETETLSNISDPFERMQMTQLLRQRRQQSMDAYGRHQANQLEVYDNQTFQGMTATYAQGAVDNYNNPEKASWYLRSAEAYIDAHSLKKGQPLEWKNKQIQDLKDNVHSDTANLLMAEDPYKASQYIAENMSNISPAIYAKTVKQLEPYRIEGLANDLIAKAATGIVPKGGQQSIDNAMFQVNKVASQPPANYKTLFVQKAQEYSVDPNLVMAVAHAENAKYDPSAKSSAGAIGLMQLMPDTARGLKLKDHEFTNPERNVDGGVRHLKRMLTLFNGNKALALAAYNAGEGHLLGYKRKDGTRNIGAIAKAKNKYGTNPTIDQIFEFLPRKEETIPYVNKILKEMGESDSTKTPPATVENTPEKAQETADIPQNKANNSPLSPSFIASGQFKNMEELTATYDKAMSAVSGSGYEEGLVRQSLTAKYKQQKTLLKDRQDSYTNTVWDAMRDYRDKNGGAIDMNNIRQNPAVNEAYLNMDPKEATALDDMAYKQEERVYRQEERDYRQQQRTVEQEKEQSRILLLMTKGEMNDNPSKLQNLNINDLVKQGMRFEEAEQLRQEKNKALKTPSQDPMQPNYDQGKNLLKEQWTLTYQKQPIPAVIYNKDGKTPSADGQLYFTQGGILQGLMENEVRLNGGKPLTREKQLELVRQVLTNKQINIPTGYFDLSSDYSGTASQFVADNTQPDAPLFGYDKSKAFRATLDLLDQGQKVTPLRIKALLDSGG